MTIPQPVRLTCGDARAVIHPADGLIVSSFTVGGRDILHPDGIIDIAGKKKRRGGIPILFPQAGSLPDRGAAQGFTLDQHGFSRDLPWRVSKISSDSHTATFTQASSPTTKKIFPFDFEVSVEISLENSALDYRLTVMNPSSKVLWTAPGLHPYFSIPREGRKQLQTNVEAFQIGEYRLDESLILPLQRVDMDIAGLGRVSMIPGGDFLRPPARLVVWSDTNDYMCFEPWAAGVGSLLRENERLGIPPNESRTMSMRMEAAHT